MKNVAYEANKQRVAAVRREFREAARAVAASRTGFADYDGFAGAVNEQIALERAAITTTARRATDYVAAAADISRRIAAARRAGRAS